MVFDKGDGMTGRLAGNARYLGIDMGTSGVKAVLFDRNGTMAGSGSAECRLISGPDGRAELDPDAVLDAVAGAVRACLVHAGVAARQVEAVGLSCQHHSLMAVDGSGSPLTLLATWADNRAVAEAEDIAAMPQAGAWYRRTGCRVQHPMYPLSKILWFRRHEPALYQKAAKFVSIKEYLLFRMFNTWVVDDTLASTQGLYNIHRMAWDPELVENLAGLTMQRLSETVPCTHVLRGMSAEWAQRLGLLTDTPVVIGSGDGIMANLGCGVFDRTLFSSTIGTSGAIRTTVDAPLTSEDGGTWCYAFLRDRWVSGGAINNGGIALSWLRREFGGQFREDANEGERLVVTMDRLAQAVPAGSEGLLFLPYLLGERCPDWNVQARGMISGLDFSHTRGHLVRAMMEGVMFRLYTVDRALMALCGYGGSLRANGGYTYSPFWLQMQADLFGREVQVSEVTEAGTLGAAFLAMHAVGAAPRLEAGLPAMAPSRVLMPDAAAVEMYGPWKARAERFYNTMTAMSGPSGSAPPSQGTV